MTARNDDNPIPKASGIYALRWPTGHFYIGQAQDLRKRASCHASMMRRGVHTNAHLQRVYHLHGQPSFEVLELCPVEDLNRVEQSCLDVVCGRGQCLNMARVAESPMRGRRWTEDQRERNLPKIMENGRKARDSGALHRGSAEATRARWADPAFRAKMAEVQRRPDVREKRVNALRAVRLTDAEKDAKADAARAQWADPDMREKMLAKVRKTRASPEYRANMSERLRATNTPERSAERSAAARMAWARRKAGITGTPV